MFSKILGSRDKKNSSDKREPLIGGRFKCSSEILGEGIEGQVRLGTDVDTNEPVALKLIDRSRLSVKDLERLDLEISILLNLRHQNIISLKHAELYCKGEDNFVATVLVMEKASCELFDYLMTGPFNDNVARTYMSQLCSALHACHSMDVFHRDIKPENLLIGSDFSLKLADFGWSSNNAALMTTQCGTVAYMAPEVIAGQAYKGAEADLWSAGCVLFIMLCGMPPFEKADVRDWWFNAVFNNRYDRFWAAHLRSAPHMERNTAARDLLNKMLVASPADRLTLVQVAAHPWFDGQFLSPQELAGAMQAKSDEMEQVKALEKSRKVQERAQLMSKRGPAAARQKHFDSFACDTTRAIGRAPTYNKACSPMSRGLYSVFYSASDGMDLLLFIRRAITDMDANARVNLRAEDFSLDAFVTIPGEKTELDDGEVISLPSYSVEVSIKVFSTPEEVGEDIAIATCFAEITRVSGDFFGIKGFVNALKKSVGVQESVRNEAEKDLAGTVFGKAAEQEEVLQDDIGMV